MSKLNHLIATFWHQFSLRSVSHHLFAQQLAKYEIFCLVLKHLMMEGHEQPVASLLTVVTDQQDDFLFYVLGLTHLSTEHNKDGAVVPTKEDLNVFATFLAGNYKDTLIYENDLIRFADSHLPSLEDYYKQKQWFDNHLVTEIGFLLRQESTTLNEKNGEEDAYSRMVAAEKQRDKLARLYLAQFESRINSATYEATEEEQHDVLDREIREAEQEVAHLWEQARPKLEAILKAQKGSTKNQTTTAVDSSKIAQTNTTTLSDAKPKTPSRSPGALK